MRSCEVNDNTYEDTAFLVSSVLALLLNLCCKLENGDERARITRFYGQLMTVQNKECLQKS